GGSIGASAASSRLIIAFPGRPTLAPPASPAVISTIPRLFRLLLELLDRAMDQDLGRSFRASERARYLLVVHAKRKPHDQRLATIIGQGPHGRKHFHELLPALD